MPLDLSVLQGSDPAGHVAEEQIRHRIAAQRHPDLLRAEDDELRAASSVSHGSVAAADSSRFHAYRKDRRHELERVEAFEVARRAEAEQQAFARLLDERKALLDAKTSKNRARRHKRRLAKANARGDSEAPPGKQ